MMYRAQGKTLDDPQWVAATGCDANPTCDRTSYNTQPTYVISVQPTSGPAYFMYMADNWVHGGPAGLIDASYVWLPIRFNEGNITIPKLWKWDFNNPDGPVPPAPPPPPPPLVPGSCRPGPPGRGGAIALTKCVAGSEGQAWSLADGTLRLRAATLCVDSVVGSGSLVAANCSATDHVLNFKLTQHTNGQLVERKSGHCLDIGWCGTRVCAGEKAGLYSCNTQHKNQQFSYSTESGQLSAEFDGHCLTACAEPHK